MHDQIQLQQRRVSLAEVALRRYSDLQNSNFVSPAVVQDKQADLLDQQQRLADLERAWSTAGRELAASQAELNDLRIQSRRDQAAGRRSIAAVEQDLAENEARRQILVRAPTSGTVSGLTVEVGQIAFTNQVLGVVLPANSVLEAELYAPSRAAGFLKPGMPVQLRYQAYAFQKFGQSTGTIREISRTAMRPEEMSLPSATMQAGGISEPLYRVRVRLDQQIIQANGQSQELRPGALLDASILLESRRLYEWVLDPLYSMTGHL